MKKHSELAKILNENFHWNKARIELFVHMIIALVQAQTVNLNKIACRMQSKATKASRFRRLQRFFSHFSIDFSYIFGFIFALFIPSGETCYLTMDRTNWQWGKSDINILMLGIVYKGIAIPIGWKLLDKRGNSDTTERIELIEAFIHQFGKERVAGILGDREFIGEDWFSWLMREKIPFWIRLKKNFLTTDSRGRIVKVYTLFRDLKPTEQRSIYSKRNIMKSDVYLSGMKLSDGDYLIVATSELPGMAIEQYAKRWEIETLFSCLKGRGFNFEDTHITDLERIKKYVAVLAIAFCWAHKTGEWLNEIKPIQLKTHGRPAVSIFRYGLDFIIDTIVNAVTKNFKNLLKIIRPQKLIGQGVDNIC